MRVKGIFEVEKVRAIKETFAVKPVEGRAEGVEYIGKDKRTGTSQEERSAGVGANEKRQRNYIKP